MLERLRLLPWLAAAAFGLAAEQTQFGWNDPAHSIPDLAVGWFFISSGFIASRRRPESRVGALMAVTGLSWYFGNFSHLGVGPIDWAASRAIYLYLGPLTHLLLTYPSGRPWSRFTSGAVAVGYAAAVTSIWQIEVTSIGLLALMVTVSARSYLREVGRLRRARRYALWATVALSLVLGGYAVVRLVPPTAAVSGPFILAYQATLCAVAVGLLAGLLFVSSERSAVTDLVVELGEAPSGSLRDALAQALADPTLEVGYWLSDTGTFVDPAGHLVPLPDRDSGRSATIVEHGGRPVAVLVHDPAVLDDPGLLEAVSSATQLAAANAQLQAEVRQRLAELMASRRRIIEAGDEERRRLERRLSEGAERRLTGLGETLRQATSRTAGLSPATVQLIDRAELQLNGTLEELRELGRGLHPRALTEQGLEHTLLSLVDWSPVPVGLSVRANGLSPRLEAAVYFVCSEGLANVAKHARAARVDISISTDDTTLRVVIVDDGVGGAELVLGSGLRGIADRADALGGMFDLQSPPGNGTRIICSIPLNSTG